MAYSFRPGGFEDDDDEFDGDGFCLGFDDVKTSKKNKVFDPITNSSIDGTRGGFGTPPPKQKKKEPQKKFKRSADVKENAEFETQPLNIGDFQMAVIRGNKDRVKQYLDVGFAIDTVLKSGWTGLMYTASNANHKLAALFLDNKANPNFHKDMYTVLMAACGASGYKEDDVLQVVQLLLGKGAKVNEHDRYHTSALMYAAREGRPNVVECLVKAGANINKQDSRGYTSLTWAVTKNQASTVRMLMQLKADPRMKHSDGETVIDLVTINENLQMLAILEGKPIDSRTSTTDVSLTHAPDQSGDNTSSSVGVSYGTTYGELELFLCGLDLSNLVDVVRSHKIDFNTFLRMTEEDLIKIGITQLGVRKKILDGIHGVHKKEWEKTSLPEWQYNKALSCGEALAIVANTSKHMKYITTTIGYLQDQIRRQPAILEQLQDGTGPKQLHVHTTDTLCNLEKLETQLHSIQKQLQQMLKKGNYEPADTLRHSKPVRARARWLLPTVVISGLLAVSWWKGDVIIQKITGS